MDRVRKKITAAQELFKQRITSIRDNGGLSIERYVRFLSCQYHLTKNVQRHFYKIASHSDFAKKKELRDWLVGFGKEEEFHFEIAKQDLKKLDREPLQCPIDTKLWWLYFDSIVEDRPFIRLGGTCILENISTGSSDVIDSILQTSTYLNKQNTRFLTIHRHGPNLAHGDEVLKALESSSLSEDEISDLLTGCDYSTAFYMRFMHWMATGELLQ